MIPLALLLVCAKYQPINVVASVLVLIGIYITEHIWVEAPQRIPLA